MMNYIVVQPFFVMWQSRMYAIHSQEQHPKIFKQVFALYSMGLIYAGLAMSLFSSEVVHVMVEHKFAASQEIIPVVVLAYIFYGLSYYAQLGLFLTDSTNQIGVIGAAGAVLNLILNFVLILHYGMMGAAWATLFSFVFIAGVSYWRSQRALPMPLEVGRMWLAMILAAGLYLLCRVWGPGTLGAAILMKGMALVIFPIVVWKTGVLPQAAAETLAAARDQVAARLSRCGTVRAVT
jgi:O-antigen/teichoic acid export membrane protein